MRDRGCSETLTVVGMIDVMLTYAEITLVCLMLENNYHFKPIELRVYSFWQRDDFATVSAPPFWGVVIPLQFRTSISHPPTK